ncbi:MAG: nickel pincer cofactor biosynthesis protein LarB [Anaerovoracaceae bacterium]|jgi:NCAIR mutase (PurE)-related protein
MEERYLKSLLEQVAQGKVDIEAAMEKLKTLPFEDLRFACIDHHRELRTSQGEVIFGQGKTPFQIASIAEAMWRNNHRILISRASTEAYVEVKKVLDKAVYHEEARSITIIGDGGNDFSNHSPPIAILTAGTADIPVAEEAAVTAGFFGNQVDRIYDVGVAGIHRLFDKLDRIRSAGVVIVAAGMEGALVSVVGGLTERPVIALPTSVGYGASFKGLAALLAMLNSCAAGVGVVNIDNGYGAACLASKINRRE